LLPGTPPSDRASAGLGLTPAFADGQIAAIATTQDLILVTRNERDYQPFANLQLANRFAP